MSNLNSYFSELNTQSDNSFKMVDKRLLKLSKKLTIKSEFIKNLNTIVVEKNRNIPAILLDNEGNVKSMSAAFEHVFPKKAIEYDIEVAQQQREHPLRYQEYELKFNKPPDDL
ncbi:Hypothetical_protein [Hexamita inflata]|uniref:Hypothetical_protein n=1 Tax=Hexamita inflata TaxID=28002 RepID=A0AA86NG19_9EUKA|nr:Hypothetical protein HINF_LOCUS6068 [Hexamita inflata]